MFEVIDAWIWLSLKIKKVICSGNLASIINVYVTAQAQFHPCQLLHGAIPLCWWMRMHLTSNWALMLQHSSDMYFLDRSLYLTAHLTQKWVSICNKIASTITHSYFKVKTFENKVKSWHSELEKWPAGAGCTAVTRNGY